MQFKLLPEDTPEDIGRIILGVYAHVKRLGFDLKKVFTYQRSSGVLSTSVLEKITETADMLKSDPKLTRPWWILAMC